MGYPSSKSDLDRNAINEIRRATTALEFDLMAPRGEFDWEPDAMAIKRSCLILMMKADEIISRVEGTDFAPQNFNMFHNTLTAQ